MFIFVLCACALAHVHACVRMPASVHMCACMQASGQACGHAREWARGWAGGALTWFYCQADKVERLSAASNIKSPSSVAAALL